MRETNETLNGATILNIELLTDDSATVYRCEYGNYELLITTDRGVLRFAGCHDAQGEIEVLDGRLTGGGE